MNKAELIEALAVRLGDKKQAVAALDAVLTEIQAVVTKGDKVAITGFGVFEKRARAARTARNPRTGEPVKVKKTSVPAFRAGAGFREMVASGKVPKSMQVKKTAKKSIVAPSKAAASTASRATASRATASRATASKATASKAAPARAAAARSAAGRSVPAKAGTAKAAAPRGAASVVAKTATRSTRKR